MRRAAASGFIALLLLAAGGSAAVVEPAWAQQRDGEARERATVRIDTVRGRRQAGPRRAAPGGVASVRRRIAQIRGGGQRVVYPIVVVAPNGGGEVPGMPSLPSALPGRQRPRVPYYLPGRSGDFSREGFYDEPASQRFDGDEVNGARPEEPQAAPATVRRVERAILETGLFETSRVHFAFDESTLLPASETILNAVGEVLARYPALRLVVEGHTDAVGPESYNQALSERRAEAVVRYLRRTFEIGPRRLRPVGRGESQPVAGNETATGRTLNRRVGFRVANPEAAEQYRETTEEEAREDLREAIRDALEAAPSDGDR